MATGEQTGSSEMELLFREYARRQLNDGQQALEAIRQANAALMAAQQIILANMTLCQTLADTGDFSQFKQIVMPTELPQEQGLVPPWRLGRPPDLQ